MTERRQIPAGEFKAKCLKLMDEVRETGEELVITKHGKPVAKLVPVDNTSTETSLVDWLGNLKGSVTILGDIVSPVVDDDWEEEWLKRWDETVADNSPFPDKEGSGSGGES